MNININLKHLKLLLPAVLPFVFLAHLRLFVWVAGYDWNHIGGSDMLSTIAFIAGIAVGCFYSVEPRKFL